MGINNLVNIVRYKTCRVWMKKHFSVTSDDVETVATWRVYNVKSSVFESLIHKLFDGVQLQVTVDGKRPKEWFVVPFPVIEQAVTYIVSGKPVAYDKNIQQLIDLSE